MFDLPAHTAGTAATTLMAGFGTIVTATVLEEEHIPLEPVSVNVGEICRFEKGGIGETENKGPPPLEERLNGVNKL